MNTSELAARAREIKSLYGDESSEPSASRAQHYADGIRDLIQERLEESNPTATIERTGYFNHSAIPDFVLSWGSKRPRGMYLRGSYAAIVAASEVHSDRRDDPVFISLDENKEFSLGVEAYNRSRIIDLTSTSKSTLVTDISAFSTATSSRERDNASPLQQLVRSNFIRGGCGLFDREQVDQLLRHLETPERGVALEEVEHLFTEESQIEFQRIAVILKIAISESAQSVLALDSASLLRGRLTDGEASALLPWIMANSSAPTGALIWRVLGSMIDLALLEKVAGTLQDVDLTRLIESNLAVLFAKRAHSVGSVERSEATGLRWEMTGSTLTRTGVSGALKFAWLGTRLKPTGPFTAPLWPEIRERITPYTLAAAAISGPNELVRVDSRQGESIRDYLEHAIPESAAREYSVDDVTVRLVDAGATGEGREVKIDFQNRLILPSGRASIESLVRISDLLEGPDADLVSENPEDG